MRLTWPRRPQTLTHPHFTTIFVVMEGKIHTSSSQLSNLKRWREQRSSASFSQRFLLKQWLFLQSLKDPCRVLFWTLSLPQTVVYKLMKCVSTSLLQFFLHCYKHYNASVELWDPVSCWLSCSLNVPFSSVRVCVRLCVSFLLESWLALTNEVMSVLHYSGLLITYLSLSLLMLHFRFSYKNKGQSEWTLHLMEDVSL